MNSAENYRRAVLFDTPERIPVACHASGAMWSLYDQNQFCDLLESHPLLFPNFKRPELPYRPSFQFNERAGVPYTDPWQCVWETDMDGIIGVVRQHPLADMSRFREYRMPDPALTDGTYPLNLEEKKRHVEACRAAGGLAQLGLPHGHTFLRLQDIRGYEDAVCDLYEENPDTLRLLDMIGTFNLHVVENLLSLNPDIMSFPEDLGMQNGPMLSPDLFRRHIKPIYRKMMQRALDSGCLIHMHSDGDIRQLVDDLVCSGVQIVNLQDLVNGIDWIERNLAHKVCIELDIDRQNVTVHGSPREIDELIRQEVSRLGSREGGLMLVYGLYPGTPIENAAAVMDAMEKYTGFFS